MGEYAPRLGTIRAWGFLVGREMADGKQGGQNPQRRLEAHWRTLKALELRLAGKGYQAIADELRYKSPASAFKAVQRALKATLQEPADELRRLELSRLDELFDSLWERRHQAHVVDRLLSIMERRAKLLGLDAPTKVDISHRLRELAEANGLNPQEVMRQAEEIIRATRS